MIATDDGDLSDEQPVTVSVTDEAFIDHHRLEWQRC